MPLTIADQIREFLGTQPEDCHKVNLDRLATALKASGPVVWQSQVVSVATEGTAHTVTLDLTRAVHEFAAPDSAGKVDLAAIPPDEELAAKWGLPLASETPLAKVVPPSPPVEHITPAPHDGAAPPGA